MNVSRLEAFALGGAGGLSVLALFGFAVVAAAKCVDLYERFKEQG